MKCIRKKEVEELFKKRHSILNKKKPPTLPNTKGGWSLPNMIFFISNIFSSPNLFFSQYNFLNIFKYKCYALNLNFVKWENPLLLVIILLLKNILILLMHIFASRIQKYFVTFSVKLHVAEYFLLIKVLVNLFKFSLF